VKTLFLMPQNEFYVPTKARDPLRKKAEELRERFSCDQIVEFDNLSSQTTLNPRKLKPGDVVHGNISVGLAAVVCASGARLIGHNYKGELIEWSAEEVAL